MRRVIELSGWRFDRHVDELGRTIGEELLEPTRVYARDCLALTERASGGMHAFSHITGGGLAANLARVLPSGVVAEVSRGGWQLPPVFSLVQRLGRVPWADLESTLNLGVGMVAVVAPDAAAGVLAHAGELGLQAWELGTVRRFEPGQDMPGNPDLISGTKGVQGGAVLMSGTYRV